MVRKKAPPLICIVDDDESVRQRLDRLIRSTGAQTSVFDSSHAFLRSYHSRTISCLVLDAHLSGVSGLQLQRMLGEANILIPIVLVTSSADVVRTRRLAHGAVKVLSKPFTDEELLSAITALVSSERDSVRR
jgi:two-component system, LuxR family, response regulator FixJ